MAEGDQNQQNQGTGTTQDQGAQPAQGTPAAAGTDATQTEAQATPPAEPVAQSAEPAAEAAPAPATPAEPTPADTTAAQGGAVAAQATEPRDQGDDSDGVVIDKNKSAEQYIKDASSKYIVPRLVREKFPDLVKLIYETESMDREEREYWLQIMPIMTEEQIVKFRKILVNEKEQLAKLDAQYKKDMARTKKAPIDEAKLKEKMEKMKAAEESSQVEEKAKEEQLLEELENI